MLTDRRASCSKRDDSDYILGPRSSSFLLMPSAPYRFKGTPLEPIWSGGHQEKGRRTGTENVIGIISLGAACAAIREHGQKENDRIGRLRNIFEKEMSAR